MSNKTVLELVSEVDEFLEMHKMFQDADLDIALSKIVRITSNPDINPAVATTAIIHLQGLSSKFYIQASYLKNISKPKSGELDYQRKNILFAMCTALDNLVAALKYAVRGN